jgi:hypothetical protein
LIRDSGGSGIGKNCFDEVDQQEGIDKNDKKQDNHI